MDCSPSVSSVHGISQARILEWVAISFSRGSSQSRDQTRISYISRQVLYHWATREAPLYGCYSLKNVPLWRITYLSAWVSKYCKRTSLKTNKTREASVSSHHIQEVSLQFSSSPEPTHWLLTTLSLSLSPAMLGCTETVVLAPKTLYFYLFTSWLPSLD